MPAARELALEAFDAWRRGDVSWAVEHSWPDVAIRQPESLPDARSYYGHDGVREALADWPRQWETFDVLDVRVIDATDEAAILFTRHQVSARGGLEFELDVFNVFAYEDDLARSWDMFMTLDEARLRFDAVSAR